MAFVKKADDEQDQNQTPTTGGGSGEVITSGGQSAPAAGPTAPVAKPGSTGSGMFDNVGRYLDVNADKAKGLANRVGGAITGDINKAGDAIGSAGQQFNKDVDAGTIRYNQGLIQNATANAQKVAADKAAADAVRSQYNAQYGGPEKFDEQNYYNQAQSAIKQAKDTANLSGTEEGRKSLLVRSNPGRPSGGVLSLNNAILQNSQEAQDIISGAAKGASSLDKRLADAAAAAGTYAAQGKAATAQARQSAQKAFADTYGSFQSGAQSKVGAAQKGAQSAAQKALDAFYSGGNLTNDQLGLLGISADQNAALRKGITDYQSAAEAAKARNAGYLGDANQFADLSKLGYGSVGTGEGLYNLSNTATADDYARLAALNQLTGRGDNFLTDPKLAGTAPGDLLDLRFGDLQKRIADATAAANSIQAVQQPSTTIDPAVEDALNNVNTSNPLRDNPITKALGNLGDKAKELSDKTIETGKKAIKDTEDEGNRVIDNTKKKTTDLKNKAQAFGSAPGKKTEEAVKKAGEDIKDESVKAKTKTVAAVKKAKEEIDDEFERTVTSIKRGGGAVSSKTKSAATKLATDLKNAIEDPAKAAKGLVKEAKNFFSLTDATPSASTQRLLDLISQKKRT